MKEPRILVKGLEVEKFELQKCNGALINEVSTMKTDIEKREA